MMDVLLLLILQVMVWQANLKSAKPCENLEVVEEERRSCSPLNVTAQVPLEGERDEDEEVVVVEDYGEDQGRQERPYADTHHDQMKKNEVQCLFS